MAWFTRFSRFGDVHLVFGQEQGMTCGPSSALMCYTKINKLTPGAQLYNSTQAIKALYERWSGRHYDGSTSGTYPEGLVYALNRMTSGQWTQTTVSASDAADRIVSLVGTTGGVGPTVTVEPIIVGVDWDGSTASHWVCIDTVRTFLGRTYATVCDPWDAGLHVQEIRAGQNFVYDAAQTIDLDLWGTHYAYPGTSRGRVLNWPFIHRTP